MKRETLFSVPITEKERFAMEIAIIAHDLKKELMTQFCIAYCGILSKHNLYATDITGKFITEATGLNIERLLAGAQGGEEQIASRISFNEIDILLYIQKAELIFYIQ